MPGRVRIEIVSMIRLSGATLNDLPETIARPTYERAALTPGIVHIGLGNFHRAHQAWYLHRLLQLGLDHDWAIIGAGVRPNDAAQRSKLLRQDCLSTLIELDPSGTSAEVIGAMIDYLPVEEGNDALIGQMADPAIRIVALPVTEGGYYVDPATKGFDAAHPDIRHDAAHPDRPRTAFARDGGGARAQTRSGNRSLHRPELRQPARQRHGAATSRGLARTRVRPGPCRVDRCELHVSDLDGRLHHAGDRPEGARAGARARHRRHRGSRHARALPTMGHRG